MVVGPARRQHRHTADRAWLSEWDYGDYEGQRSVDICEGRPNWIVFRDGCPHGEMPAEISDRADRLIARLQAQEGNVALFSHGQFGAVLAARWIGLPAIDGQDFPLGAASLIIPHLWKGGAKNMRFAMSS
jgi:broad specificity phosphatase PhoE